MRYDLYICLHAPFGQRCGIIKINIFYRKRPKTFKYLQDLGKRIWKEDIPIVIYYKTCGQDVFYNLERKDIVTILKRNVHTLKWTKYTP